MILLSSPHPEPVAVLIVLPEGGRVTARFTDDGSVRDITGFAADLIAEYVLRAPPGVAVAEDTVVVAEIRLEDCPPGGLRLAVVDTRSHQVGEIPPEQFTTLLGQALAMAVTAAVEAAADEATADGDPTGADPAPS